MNDPSVCRLHPGVAVTGFCPACLSDRLAGLQPPSSTDLRRCKSFSYARSAAGVEPQRRSCDLFRHQQQHEHMAAAAEEQEDYYQYHQAEEETPARLRVRPHGHPHEQERKSLLGGLLGKKLQQWRRKSSKEPAAAAEMPGRQGQRQRPSCDAADPSASWDARPMPVLARLHATTTMLSSSLPVEEDDVDNTTVVPRSDGQIPVEEDYGYGYDYYYGAAAAAAAPGGSAQTRDYYLDSSSSSRRRRSLDHRSTTASGRNSFSDVGVGELPVPVPCSSGGSRGAMNAANGNARVSPAIAAERPLYHHHHYHEAQSVLVHHHQSYCASSSRGDDFSGSAFRDHNNKPPPAAASSSSSKKGIRGWSIWGLIHKNKSSKNKQADDDLLVAATGGAEDPSEYYQPWPELRARGYNGQMLRCNSSISARRSFSGGAAAAMIGGSGRRSIDMRDVVGLSSSARRRDEVLLERTRSSSSSSSHYPAAMAAMGGGGGAVHHHQQQQQSSRPPNIPRRSSSKHELMSSLHRRSTLGLY